MARKDPPRHSTGVLESTSNPLGGQARLRGGPACASETVLSACASQKTSGAHSPLQHAIASGLLRPGSAPIRTRLYARSSVPQCVNPRSTLYRRLRCYRPQTSRNTRTCTLCNLSVMPRWFRLESSKRPPTEHLPEGSCLIFLASSCHHQQSHRERRHQLEAPTALSLDRQSQHSRTSDTAREL